MNEATKRCPTCAEEIKLDARVCRFCGARFMVRESGYCENCHRLVNINSDGKCSTCSGEVIDRHVVSALIANTAPPPGSEPKSASHSVSPVQGTIRTSPPGGLFKGSNKKSAAGVMDFGQLYFLPQGRINRRTFVLEGILPLAVLFTLYLIIILSFGSYGGNINAFWTTLIGLVMLVMLWTLLMLLVKRLHDLGKSGWATLYWLVPYAGITLYSIISPLAAADAAVVYGLVSVVVSIVFLVQLFRCIFVKGDILPNKYGQEPEWLPTSRVVSSGAASLSVKDSLSQRRILTVGALALFLIPLSLFSLIRYFIDQNTLKQGLTAFEQADCITANAHFDKVIQSWRMLDFGGLEALAQKNQDRCEPYLSAVEKEESGEYANALSAFTDLALSDSTAPSLARAARKRIESMFEAYPLSEMTSVESCQKMPDIQSAGLIPQPEVRLPEVYFACASAYQAGGNDGEAFRLHKQLLVEYPKHVRASEAEKALLSNPAACEQVDSLAKEPILATRVDFMVRLYYGCARTYETAKENSKAFDMYKQVLVDYPDHLLAGDAEKALLANSAFCEYVIPLQNQSVIASRGDLLPSLLYSCGQSYENKNQYQEAVEMYETFLDHYPNHAQASDVNTALARSLVNAARAAGAGEISPPSKSGKTSKGSTQVVIQNDSPEKLRLVFSGPEALIVELDACSSCTTFMITPFSCPELGPVGRYTLQPGTYDVLVESISDSGVTPYTGSWELVSGDQYSSCFFIIQQFNFTP